MLTILGSLLGFGTSFLPKVLDFFQDRQDKKHELSMLDRSIQGRREIAEVEAEGAAEVARYEHDTKVVLAGGKFLAFISGSVRPVTTYMFLALFFITKVSVLAVFAIEAWLLYETARMAGVIFTEAFLDGGRHLAQALGTIWDEPSTAMFATIMAFWFGDRSRVKRYGK